MRRQESSSAIPANTLLAGAIVILLVAAIFALTRSEPEVEAAPEPTGPTSPFSDLPPEAPPEKQ